LVAHLLLQQLVEEFRLSIDTRKFTLLKFGGTSVADARNWKRIARLVRDARGQHEHPVLVCSAVAGVTDALERLIATVAINGDPRGELVEIERLHRRLGAGLEVDATAVLRAELTALADLATRGAELEAGAPTAKWQSRVLSMGELMSTRLAAHWLEATGLRAHWVDARGLLRAIPQDGAPPLSAYLSAECGYAPSAEIQRRLRSEDVDVTITQGFIASNRDDETVLLGRGGSDTSAAYIAAILDAERLEIWTDVPGLFTSDPRREATARLVLRLTYDEAAILGSLGAKVLHPRCLPPAKAARIPLHIRWTQRPEVAGTIIDGRATIRALSRDHATATSLAAHRVHGARRDLLRAPPDLHGSRVELDLGDPGNDRPRREPIGGQPTRRSDRRPQPGL
jgi:diaminopimelate decarboxylase/aspartate kinase